MEKENNQCLNINESYELTKEKILNSALIKELRKYKEENTKLKQDNEILHSIIENLEEENKILKSDFSFHEGQKHNEELPSEKDICVKSQISTPDKDLTDGIPKFKVTAALETNVHKEKRNNHCTICNNSFSIAGNLRTHILTVHEGNRDHKCKSCGKSFPLVGE